MPLEPVTAVDVDASLLPLVGLLDGRRKREDEDEDEDVGLLSSKGNPRRHAREGVYIPKVLWVQSAGG